MTLEQETLEWVNRGYGFLADGSTAFKECVKENLIEVTHCKHDSEHTVYRLTQEGKDRLLQLQHKKPHV